MKTVQEYKSQALEFFASAASGKNRMLFLDMLADLLKQRDELERLPSIVCLCGSTRFYKEFTQANFELTMKGQIVLSVGFFANAAESEWKLRDSHGENIGISPEEKVMLDELHKRKIDLCDYVYVLNVGGYVGDSTRSEIDYATALGKPIRYLNELHVPQPPITVNTPCGVVDGEFQVGMPA